METLSLRALARRVATQRSLNPRTSVEKRKVIHVGGVIVLEFITKSELVTAIVHVWFLMAAREIVSLKHSRVVPPQ